MWWEPFSYWLLSRFRWFRKRRGGHWVHLSRGAWAEMPGCWRGEVCENYWSDGLQQTTWCWCPKCGSELCSQGEMLEDTDLVRYRCARCEHRSGWYFDTPAPMIVEGH